MEESVHDARSFHPGHVMPIIYVSIMVTSQVANFYSIRNQNKQNYPDFENEASNKKTSHIVNTTQPSSRHIGGFPWLS